MSRKKKAPDAGAFPVPGDTLLVDWLPRDVRLGAAASDPAGKVLVGWDATTDTFQAWELGKPELLDEARKAKFLGYVHPGPPGRSRRHLEPSAN